MNAVTVSHFKQCYMALSQKTEGDAVNPLGSQEPCHCFKSLGQWRRMEKLQFSRERDSMLAVCQLLLRLCFLHRLAQVSLCCPEKQANHPAVNKAGVARHQATGRGSRGRMPGLLPVLNEQCWLPQLITSPSLSRQNTWPSSGARLTTHHRERRYVQKLQAGSS